MPNLDPLINQNNEHIDTRTITNTFEKELLSIRDERQKMIRPNCHPTYNERHEKIIELIEWTLDKYRANRETQQEDEQVIIDNIIEELDKKREIAINKKQKTVLKGEMLKYSEEEDTIDYILFIINESTVNCIKIKTYLMVPSIFFPKLK
jgi:hypothetical protein